MTQTHNLEYNDSKNLAQRLKPPQEHNDSKLSTMAQTTHRSVSTHRQTVSTPLASTVLTASWDSHLVSTHRWTVSTPLVEKQLEAGGGCWCEQLGWAAAGGAPVHSGWRRCAQRMVWLVCRAGVQSSGAKQRYAAAGSGRRICWGVGALRRCEPGALGVCRPGASMRSSIGGTQRLGHADLACRSWTA
ncbi:hypothetical protein Taro_004386 [Colocasia esculenta]|uniref:Uncharacterized protein n=1 Tax=Colocasia esculenta TaxID=4460 RepID=A0A843TUR7_COLES|nr:hypothetical protein [Colocasia esculenta]